MSKPVVWTLAVLSLCGLAGGQTLDEVLAKNYQSRGGLEKLKAVTAVKMSGRIAMPAQGLEMPMVLWQKSPNRMRVETTFQDKKIVQAYDGRKGWWIMPFQSEAPREMEPGQAKLFAAQAEFENPLVVFREKGNKLELLGREDMDGTPVFKLKLTKTDGSEIYIYLDAARGIELRSTLATKSADGEALNEIIYGDYRPVGGVMMPFSVENRLNGETSVRMTLENIEVNPAISDALFAMPQKAAPAKTAGPKPKKPKQAAPQKNGGPAAGGK